MPNPLPLPAARRALVLFFLCVSCVRRTSRACLQQLAPAAQHRQSTAQPSPHPCTSRVAVNHLCETIWLPLDAPRTCSPRFNPLRPSPPVPSSALSVLNHRPGTATLPLPLPLAQIADRPLLLLLLLFLLLSTVRPPAHPPCPLAPSRAAVSPCPSALVPATGHQHLHSPLHSRLPLHLPLASARPPAIISSLSLSLECRRVRADVCGVDEWRGPSTTSRAP